MCGLRVHCQETSDEQQKNGTQSDEKKKPWTRTIERNKAEKVSGRRWKQLELRLQPTLEKLIHTILYGAYVSAKYTSGVLFTSDIDIWIWLQQWETCLVVGMRNNDEFAKYKLTLKKWCVRWRSFKFDGALRIRERQSIIIFFVSALLLSYVLYLLCVC